MPTTTFRLILRVLPVFAFLCTLISAHAGMAQLATYRLTVDNAWSEASHPGSFPANAHFSWIGGGSHNASVSFWDEGVLATPGIKQMAENGVTTPLIAEVEAAVTAGAARASLNWMHWFCPLDTTNPSCGELVVEFEVDESFPLVTLVTMLGPSPDWFVGVSGLALHDGSNWIDDLVIDLRPYDGGVRDQNVFLLGGPLTTPADPVSLITAASGQLIGPGSLGTFRFEKLSQAVPSLSRGVALLLVAALVSTAFAARQYRTD